MMLLTHDDVKKLSPYLDTFATKYYGQLDSIDLSEQPIIFYSTGELTFPGSSQQRYVKVKDIFQEVIQKDIQNLYCHGGEEIVSRIFDYSKKVISDASTVIESCSSMFIMIEGNLIEQKESLHRNGLYNHYHPKRHNREECHVLSYLDLCLQNQAVSECFEYQDLHSVGYHPPRWYGMSHKERAEELIRCNSFPMKVHQQSLSSEGCLRIEFDATRWFHGVKPFTANMWIMTVFNDVNFIQKHEYGPPKFSVIKF